MKLLKMKKMFKTFKKNKNEKKKEVVHGGFEESDTIVRIP